MGTFIVPNLGSPPPAQPVPPAQPARPVQGMKVSAIPLADAFAVSPDNHTEDNDGSFVNLFCFRALGIIGRRRIMPRLANVSFSRSARKHTLSGMRYEQPQYAQAKLISCLRGEAQYIILDLRPNSPTFKNHHSIILCSQGDMIYSPAGFAHGYLSLTDECEFLYMSDGYYTPDAERGFRYDDPAFNLPWQTAPAVISEKDKNWSAFSPDEHLEGMENLYP